MAFAHRVGNTAGMSDDDSFVCHYNSIERELSRRNSDHDHGARHTPSTPLSSTSPNVRVVTPGCSARTPRMPVPSNALLCTPQPCKRLVELQAQLDAELDDTHADLRRYGQPLMTEVFPGLIVGGFPSPTDLDQLYSAGVRTVVTVCGADQRPAVSDQFAHHVFDARDATDYYILVTDYDSFAEVLDAAFERNEKVFVHCIAGVNRSTTLCLAYVVHRRGLTPIQAVRALRAKGRPIILENHSFRRQLIEFYLDLQIPTSTP
jgi:protein-tyrosine phosphatase